MVICPDCGNEVPDAKFCKNCGAKLPEKNEVEDVDSGVAVPIETEETDSTVVKETIEVEEDEVTDSSVEEEEVEEIPEKKVNVKFCHNCGYKLEGNFRFCPNCGYDLENKVRSSQNNYTVQASGEKSVILSVFLSIIFPGLGHFYLGLNRKGAIFLLGYIISAVLILLIVGLLLCAVLWIWSLVDVVQSTEALNRGESVEDKLF